MKRIIQIILVLCTVSTFAEVSFSGLNISESNKLLFKATTDAPVNGNYDTLFLADVESAGLEQLSFFPEVVMLAGRSSFVQIINRFGVFRSDDELKHFSAVERFPSFVNGGEIQTGKINAPSSSPDGKYLLILSNTGEGLADLLLYNTDTGNEVKITGGLEYRVSTGPAVWSPGSGFFIYAKDGKLFYFSLEQLEKDRVINEEFRSIGKGDVANVQWGADGNLYYVSGSLVYRIRSEELFTRTLYSKLLNIGEVAGKIPFDFDPNFDDFWISPDGSKILLGKSGRNIFLFFLQSDDFVSTGLVQSLPYLFLPRNTQIKKVLWSNRDTIRILSGSIEHGKRTTGIFALDLSTGTGEYVFKKSDEEGIVDLALSPDHSTVAVVKNDEVVLRSYADWQNQRSFKHPSPLHALWRDNTSLIVAGQYYTQLLHTDTGETEIICLSQADEFGFAPDSQNEIRVKVLDTAFSYMQGEGITPIGNYETTAAKVASSTYRVYLELSSSRSYRNMVMVRKAVGFGTEPLFRYPKQSYEAFPKEDEPVDMVNFNHGSRIRRREVALVFNAIDTVEGLTTILNTLAEYNVSCTFFINGEFMRRHPDAVKEIAESGHEVGSLFFSYFNMTDASFKIDKDFIKQGLARNEDDYFSITGKELSLIWHAPYYFANTDIISASREMNYTYIGRDVDPLDWVSSSDPTLSAYYLPSTALVERILKLKKPGSIIPVRVGKTEPGREDYLFQRMDVLINGLISSGYTIVPVTHLIDHAR
ncbi:MAG: polysaccharide deacetylase family protein [Spirochaetales bacterium]|nr:polysaccharide deacetylase family protein [Spirochaetales bacterium]